MSSQGWNNETRSPLSPIQSLPSWRLLATEPKLFPPAPTVSPPKKYRAMVKITAAATGGCKPDHEAGTQGRIHGQLLQQVVHFIQSSTCLLQSQVAVEGPIFDSSLDNTVN